MVRSRGTSSYIICACLSCVSPITETRYCKARRAARVSANGELVTLDEQDRGAWDGALVAEGHRLVRQRLATGRAPGRYQILAAINAVHTAARDARDTDWSQVVALATSSFISTRRRSSP